MKRQQWRISAATSDQFDSTYDYAGNRLTQDIPGSLYAGDDRDQKFAHDNLHRLKTFDEGTLSTGNISSPTFEEDYTLDELGNWTNLVKKTGGTTSLDHGRAPNEANETGTISTTTVTPWEDPAYDDAGNMTTIPQPKALASGESETLNPRQLREANRKPSRCDWLRRHPWVADSFMSLRWSFQVVLKLRVARGGILPIRVPGSSGWHPSGVLD